MANDKIARALDVCLQTLQSVGGLEQALEQVNRLFPRWKAELNPLVKSAFLAQQMGEAIQVPDTIIASQRAVFLQEMQEIIPATRKARRQFPVRAALFGALLAGVLLFFVIGAGLLFGRALPGSIFYPMKEGGRQIRLLLTRDSIERIRLTQVFDLQRVDEIALLKQRPREVRVNFGGNLVQSPEGNWVIAQIPVQLQTDTRLVGNIWSGVYVQVRGELQKDGNITAERIQAQQFLVRGTVELMTAERLVVSGLPMMLTGDTLILGILMPDARVEVTTLLSSGDLFLARRVKVLSSFITGEE